MRLGLLEGALICFTALLVLEQKDCIRLKHPLKKQLMNLKKVWGKMNKEFIQ